MAVHIIDSRGHALCGSRQELWVGTDQAHLATCRECIDLLHLQDEWEVQQYKPLQKLDHAGR